MASRTKGKRAAKGKSKASKNELYPYKRKDIDITKLKAHPDQPKARTITEKALKNLDGSIKKIGYLDEIIYNKRTKRILSGHQRRKVLIAQGHTTVQVKEMDLTPKEEKAVFWLMNNSKNQGEFGPAAKPLLQTFNLELGDEALDVGLQNLEVSLAEYRPEVEKAKQDPEELPKLASGRGIKHGDIFQLGQHRLVCGDNREPLIFESCLKDDSPHMTFGDPPFDMVLEQISEVCARCLAVSKGVFWMGSDKQIVQLAAEHIKSFNHLFIHDIYSIDTLGVHKPKQLHNSIAYFGRLKMRNLRDGFATVIRVQSAKAKGIHEIHSQAKRVALPFEFIIHYTTDNGIVLDPYGGAGSTLMACELSGRQCRMIEIEPKYCELIMRRWEGYTGLKAQKIKKQTRRRS